MQPDKNSKRPVVGIVQPFTGIIVSVQSEGVVRILGARYALLRHPDGAPGFQTVRI